MKQYRVWCLRIVVSLVLIVAFTVSANYVLDPLYCFNNTNWLNERAVIIDQRQEKTNRLMYEDRYYDALLIGSSRSEPIAPAAFGGERVFNYSVPAIFPGEYLPYLRFAHQERAPQLKKIYLGLDFFGSNSHQVVVNPTPESYFRQASQRNYRLTNLASAGPLKAWMKRLFEKDYYYRYDRRQEVLTPRTMSESEIKRFTEKRLSVFRERFYPGTNYTYNANLPSLYRMIQTQFPDVMVVPFTSPVSLPLLQSLVAAGRYPDYERWLTEIVETFGAVYHFMDANSIARDQSNFYDADHLHPHVAGLIARRLTGQRTGMPEGFGIYITRETLQECMTELRKRHERVLGPLSQR